MMTIEISKTNRGFFTGKFTDSYGANCSIQESSSVDPRIWLGSDDDQERHHVTGELMSTRMHLDREQVAELLPLLHYFVENGHLPRTVAALNAAHEAADALSRPAPAPVAVPDVDWLSNVIRQADGNHTMGAGRLAESIVEAMIAAPSAPATVASEADTLRAQLAERDDVLRSLACWLSVGGYNAEIVDPAAFEQKIRMGVDMLTKPLDALLEDYREKLAASEAQLAERDDECKEQARLNGMGTERELALMAKLAASEAREVDLMAAAMAMLNAEYETRKALLDAALSQPSKGDSHDQAK